MKNLKDKVLYCLERYPETRDSDIKLTHTIWFTYYEKYLRKDGNDLYVKLTDVYELPTIDHVSRWRRKVQESGRYLPTSWEVAKQRRINETVWRNALGYNDNVRNLQ